MNNHKLLAFTHSSDSSMYFYIQNQIQYIKNEYPDLEIEHLDESDTRLKLFSEYPNRFPAYILLKHGRRKNYIHSKMTNEAALSWLLNKLG